MFLTLTLTLILIPNPDPNSWTGTSVEKKLAVVTTHRYVLYLAARSDDLLEDLRCLLLLRLRLQLDDLLLVVTAGRLEHKRHVQQAQSNTGP